MAIKRLKCEKCGFVEATNKFGDDRFYCSKCGKLINIYNLKHECIPFLEAYCTFCRGIRLIPEGDHAKCPSCGGRYSLTVSTQSYEYDCLPRTKKEEVPTTTVTNADTSDPYEGHNVEPMCKVCGTPSIDLICPICGAPVC